MRNNSIKINSFLSAIPAIIFGLLLAITANGQSPITTDPTLESITLINGQQENKAYKNILDHQTKIQRLQTLTMAAESQINRTKRKIYEGLHYVSSALQNAYDIYICGEILEDIYTNERQMIQTARKNPVALGWALKFQKIIIEKSIGTFSQIKEVILKKDNEKYLMDAGERANLLMHIRVQLQAIQGFAMRSNYTVQWVVNEGVINALNPYASWTNRDGQIVNNILKKWSF